jgi:tetratricopeptide (TPR) repeat protein
MTETMAGGRRPMARRWAILALSVLSLSGTACNKFKSKQLIREGNVYFKEQMYEDALKKYEAAQALDPQEVRLDKFVAMGNMALYNPGSTHPKDQEALAKAIEHFKKYLAAKPEDDKAAKFLVTTYMNAQRYDDAIEYFKELIAKHPTDAQAAQTIAMLYARKGDYENSITWQKKRGELEPTNADVFYTMGVTAWDKSYNTVSADISADNGLTPEKRREIIDFGMAQLNKAVELRPDYFEAMFYINLLYREYAKMESAPTKVAELKGKADEWQRKGLEMKKKVQERQRLEQAKKNPLEAL